MRITWLVILAAGLLAACSAGYSTQKPPPVASGTCTRGYPWIDFAPAASSVIDVGVADNGHKIRAHLCDTIDVVLVGRPISQWQPIQSSDESVIKVVPLPLPHPPPGDANLVFVAERTGTAVLSSTSGAVLACPPTATCAAARWSVTVTVVT